MQMTNNTILVTGGGSGIGRALAEAFAQLGNRVAIAGRDRRKLDAVTAAHPGMTAFTVDLTSADSIRDFAAAVTATHPDLNGVIHSAGVMKPEDLLSGPSADVDVTVATNLLGPMRLTAAVLPTLLRQPRATVMTVSSGLAFVPMAMTPTYSATKAAVHSYTQSLRYQLRDTAVQVMELIPPYVATELMGPHQARDPDAMPLDEYVAEVMKLLAADPDAAEVNVGRVRPLRYAAEGGAAKYDGFFKQFNDHVTAAAKKAGR